MANVEALERCEWPGGCTNTKAPPAPTGGNPPRYCEQEVDGQRHDARERYRLFGRKSERLLPPALAEARPAEGLRAEMDRTQLAVEALTETLARYGDAEAIEERIAVVEREAAAGVQAAEAKATQALAENDQRLAAIKRDMATAVAAREEALADAAAARDANAQLEQEVIPRLEAAVATLEEQLESERAAHSQALADQSAKAAADLEAVRAKADARVTAADEQTKKAKDAARVADEAAREARAATQAAEAVAAEQRTELTRLREEHAGELTRLREEHATELGRVRDQHAAEVTQLRAEADARVTEARQEVARQTEAHAAELERVQQQADARLAERVDSLNAAHAAQLEARDARITAAEQLAAERAGERDRLEAEIAMLGEQIRALNAAAAQRQADQGGHPPARPASRRRTQKPTAGE